MAFVDEIQFHIKAGDGGDGVVRWLHEKGKEYGGPAGGNGGKGGDVIIRGVRDIGLLAKYRNLKEFRAENGENGKSKSMHGKGGDDLVIDLPLGSVVRNVETAREIELLEDGKEVFLLAGGRGGYGNEHFKGSKNVRPYESTPGKPGEEGDFEIELRLIADAGLVGLPNAGKTSLINELTNADAKVGSYQFTTLEPNLGAFYGYIIADIPGLIEGASEGKGLGDKFLRHIRRTKILLHCISLENEDLAVTYDVVRGELAAYDPALLEKREIIVLTKTDLVEPKLLEKAKRLMKKKAETVLAVSVIDDASIKAFRKALSTILENL